MEEMAPCDVEDFECALCVRLLYEPATLVCGHSFCRRCLKQALRHKSSCPLCRKGAQPKRIAASMKTYNDVHVLSAVFGGELEVSRSLDALLRRFFPKEHTARAIEDAEDAVELEKQEGDGMVEVLHPC